MAGEAPIALFVWASTLVRARVRPVPPAWGTAGAAVAAGLGLLAGVSGLIPAWASLGLSLAALALILGAAPLSWEAWADVALWAVVPAATAYGVWRWTVATGPLLAAVAALVVGGGLAWLVGTRGTSARVDAPNGSAGGDEAPDTRPQWLRIMACLEGSSDPDVPPQAGWTQKAIAAQLNVAPARVSEFPAMLNDSARWRLDELVPGWVEPAGGVNLVLRYRGAVVGERGVWTFYRLTPLGEALLTAAAARTGPQLATDA